MDFAKRLLYGYIDVGLTTLLRSFHLNRTQKTLCSRLERCIGQHPAGALWGRLRDAGDRQEGNNERRGHSV
ncbi:MAG: hypothetical protein COZ05_16645 [Armatimonadetes bacterium CG_4_10_14_3_um_filter_59_10]|nr:MAG: hypothetical protein COZ05_16645 [Armatimonadetes bacterium CG_4_10_14_3_um_filter_59_10]